MSSVIEVADLHKTYRGGWFRSGYEALRGVSLGVQPGEIFALLGPNGAGKTTLIKVLLGIVRKSGGSASLLGQPAGHRASRRRVGYLPEQLRLPRHHNGRSALNLLGKLSGMAPHEIAERRDPLLQRVGLASWANISLKKYSKGMLQRLGLAQALLHNPDVLILDEPTDGLDPVGRREVRDVLQELKDEGKTIFINSHMLQEVELVCDRVAILSQGQLRYLGEVEELSAELNAACDEVWMEVIGAEAEVDAAMAPWEVLFREAHGESWRLTLRLSDQTAIDQCVDALRSRGLSVTHLAKKRMTLEDAFLSLIGTTAEPPGANL